MIRKRSWSLFAICLLAAAAQAREDEVFSIRGRLVDADAKPVAGAKVRLLAAGFNGFDVDEKTTTDNEGRFRIAAPKSWSRMDVTQRQELALLAAQGKRIAAVRFSRYSVPPRAEVELMLEKAGATSIAILSPDLQPVVGAKVKMEGLNADTIHANLTEAEAKQWAGARKTTLGYATGTGTVSLPADLQVEIGTTDGKGLVTLSSVAAARLGAVAVQSDAFGEQTVSPYLFGPLARKKDPDWPQRIVLKKVGGIVGQLSCPIAEAVARREVTFTTHQVNDATGIVHGSHVRVVTDRDGKFEAAKLLAGLVQFDVQFNPELPTRPVRNSNPPQLKADEKLSLKIELKPAVRVEGRVLEAESRKPIPGIRVRAYLGFGFESATSDAQGKFVFWMAPGETAFHPNIPDEFLGPISPSDYYDSARRQQSAHRFSRSRRETLCRAADPAAPLDDAARRRCG